MTLQNELYMFFRRLPDRNLFVDTLLCRWQLIGLIRKAMSTLSMGIFIASQSRNYELGATYINMLNKAIKAHIYVVSLPAIISINADDIYRQPVLHQYYLQFPEYRDHHKEIRELIAKEEYIRDNVEGITALAEYYGIEELYKKIAWFAENPPQLSIAVSTFLLRAVLHIADNAFRVIDYITSVFRADDPDLLKHIVSVKLLRAFNVMHDADFAMQATMIYKLDTYRHIFAEIQREMRPRPFLHYGTSRFTMTPKGQPEKTILEYPQPLERELIVKIPNPRVTTTFAFEHETIRNEYHYTYYLFGQAIMTGPSPGSVPEGIGGDATVIWHSDRLPARLFELSTTDFSVLRRASTFGGEPSGTGGDATVIYHCERRVFINYQLSPTDFSVIRRARAPGRFPEGIGGDATVIWHTITEPDLIFELSTTDLSIIRRAVSPGRYSLGIGGDATRIWYSEQADHRIFQLSTTDFSAIRWLSFGAGRPSGIGGDKGRIWVCNVFARRLYKLGTR